MDLRYALKKSILAVSIDDSRLCQIIGGHLYCHPIPDQNSNIPHAHLSTKMGQDIHPVLEDNPKHHVRKELLNGAF